LGHSLKSQSTRSFHFNSLEGVSGNSIALLEIGSAITYEGEGSGLFSEPSGVRRWVSIIDGYRADSRVKGMLVRINSPGGTIGSTQELYEAMKRFKASGKKIVVSVVDICASGAYYAALPADSIIANPGSLVGSIGVIISSLEFSSLMKRWGVRDNTIKSGKYKDMLSPMREMTSAERAELQSTVTDMYEIFLGEVIKHRGKKSSASTIRSVSDGRVFAADRARRLGLIDEIGDMEVAKKKIASLCGLKNADIDFIVPERSRFQDFMSFTGKWKNLFDETPSMEYRYRGI
jgi:protease IV